MLTYPMTSGRNFDEVLRLLDSCQLTARHEVATPVNWRPGEDVIIAGSVSLRRTGAPALSRRLEGAAPLSAHRAAAALTDCRIPLHPRYGKDSARV
jgi:hypothetical protein